MTTIENLQLRDKTLSCLKIDKNITTYPIAIFPKIKSLLLVDNIEKTLLHSISTDSNLRDFLCVDIQDIGNKLNQKHRKFIESQNYKETFFIFRNFGFVNNDTLKNQDEQHYLYLKNITLNFAVAIESVVSGNYFARH